MVEEKPNKTTTLCCMKKECNKVAEFEPVLRFFQQGFGLELFYMTLHNRATCKEHMVGDARSYLTDEFWEQAITYCKKEYRGVPLPLRGLTRVKFNLLKEKFQNA